MATSKEAPKKDGGDEAAAPKKSKKLLIIIVVAVLLLALIGGGTAVFLSGKKKTDGATDNQADSDQAASGEHNWPKFDPHKPPVFLALEPFTVNLQPEGDEQYLQVVASLRVIDEKVGEEVKAYMPQIRHEILSLLAGKKASEIKSQEGREELAQDIKDTVNEIMGWEPPAPKKKKKGAADTEEVGPVVAVFFTQYIVQ